MADVLDLRACLANFCFLETHLGARAPTKDGERSCTNLALLKKSAKKRFQNLSKRLLRHSDVRIFSKACLAQHWELSALPSLTIIRVRVFGGARHLD